MRLAVASALAALAASFDLPFDRCASSHGVSENDDLFVFSVSEDAALWQKRQRRGRGWSDWKKVGGNLRVEGAPSVARGVDGRMRLFVRGVDHALYYTSQLERDGDAWDRWTCFGGQFAWGPATVVNSEGFIEVYAVGRDAALYTMAQVLNGTSSSWSEWSELGARPPPPPPRPPPPPPPPPLTRLHLPAPGGNLIGAPTAVVDAEGFVHVFGRGEDRALWHIRQSARLPYAFDSSEAELPEPNDAAALLPSPVPQLVRRDALVRGAAFELVWSEWQSLGGALVRARRRPARTPRRRRRRPRRASHVAPPSSLRRRAPRWRPSSSPARAS